jgi:hypothetical protein
VQLSPTLKANDLPGVFILSIRTKEKMIRHEAISKLGFWSKVKADPSFNPQAY